MEVRDILALIVGQDNVGDNWRVVRPFTRLRQIGVNARWFWGSDDTVLPTDPEHTILVVRLLTGADPETIDRWIAERRPKVRAIIYEADDICWGDPMVDHLEEADFLQDHTREQLLWHGEMAHHLASLCDGVIVSSEPLAEYVRATIDRPVVVVPNAIDVRWFRAQMAHRAPWWRHLTVGWCGGRRPDRDIAAMAEAWGRVAKRYPEVRFVVAGSKLPAPIAAAVPEDRLIVLPWVSWEDAPVLYQTTIGCASVTDTLFNRCKTSIKLWEYTTAGAAVVASRTLYGDCLPGWSLDPVETVDEWDGTISLLIEDADRRAFHRNAMQRHVTTHHSLDGQLQNWLNAYASIVGARELVTA